MQFRDLHSQYKRLKKETDQAVAQVLQDGNFISGCQVQELEQQLADYTGVRHCITCASGTANVVNLMQVLYCTYDN